MSIDSQILIALRGADAVSGAELSNRLGISRAAVWARIQDLRNLGYDIEASPHEGYRLISTPDRLHADDLLAQLGFERGRDFPQLRRKIRGVQVHVDADADNQVTDAVGFGFKLRQDARHFLLVNEDVVRPFDLGL